MTKRLEGMVALVTGAGRGIGLAIAERLARNGARIVLCNLDEDEARAAARELSVLQGGQEVPIAIGDLSDETVAKAAVNTAIDAHGRLDILVNNAGGGIILPFAEHTPQTIRTTIDRNLWTAIWCCYYTLPVMREQGFGRIINVGADSVRNGLWAHAAYNAAKGGVHGMTTGLAREFAMDGITVNTVAPCATNTPQMAEISARDPELANKFLSVIPMGRPAEMEEIAALVCYLASREAAFTTGQVISINGGSTML